MTKKRPGRPRVDSVKRTYRLDRKTIEAVERQLFDPYTQSVQPGSSSRLIGMLLRKWLADPTLVPSPLKKRQEDEHNLHELAQGADDNEENSLAGSTGQDRQDT